MADGSKKGITGGGRRGSAASRGCPQGPRRAWASGSACGSVKGDSVNPDSAAGWPRVGRTGWRSILTWGRRTISNVSRCGLAELASFTLHGFPTVSLIGVPGARHQLLGIPISKDSDGFRLRRRGGGWPPEFTSKCRTEYQFGVLRALLRTLPTFAGLLHQSMVSSLKEGPRQGRSNFEEQHICDTSRLI